MGKWCHVKMVLSTVKLIRPSGDYFLLTFFVFFAAFFVVLAADFLAFGINGLLSFHYFIFNSKCFSLKDLSSSVR